MKQLKERIAALRNNKLVQVSSATAVLMAVSGSAHAELDTAVSGAFTSLTSSIGDYSVPAYTLLSAVLLFFIGLKWFRRVAHKAT